MENEAKQKRGGARSGAGRPKSDGPGRKLRTFKFTDEEWEVITRGAQEHRMSARHYISFLAFARDACAR